MQQRKTNRCFLLPFLAVILLLLSGCGNRKRQELKAVTEPPYPPFEYYVGDRLTGIDIDIMQEIARRLDRDLKIQPISFDAVMKSVTSGEADIALSCITITADRSRFVNFSIPYMHVGQMVVVPVKSSIRRIENLRGKVIGVQEGTTGEKYVRENYGQAVAMPNIDVATDALAGGKIDALVLDSIPAEDIVAKNRSFRVLPGKLTQESYGIAVTKAQPELLKQINGILADLLKSGWIDRSVKRHVNRTMPPQTEVLQSVRKLKIGIVPTYPPYEMKENGILKGIDIDIIQQLCDELGCVPSFIEINSDTIYQSIAEDDITISISSITITEERKKTVDFSIPYSTAAQRIMVKEGSGFRSRADLRGKTLGVVTGTTSEEQGLAISNVVERYSEPGLLLSALAKGEVDAVILDDFILEQAMRQTGGFRLLPDVLAREEYGIAISKKEPELREKIDRILRKMKQDGSLARIHDKYLSEKLRTEE